MRPDVAHFAGQRLKQICSFQEERASNINILACLNGKLHSKSSCAQFPSPRAFAEIFPGVGASRPFAYPLQVVDDAAQIDIHKTLPSFYTIKQMPIVTATLACSGFPLRKFTLSKCLFL